MAESSFSTDFLLLFTPHQWRSVTKFRRFIGPPFKVTKELAKGADTTDNHLAKFSVLAGLANRLKDQLAEDEAELADKGYSSASRSKEFAALAEALFCELYAALDGVRRTLYAAYKSVKGVQNGSTEKLFKRAGENKYGPEFPTDIHAVLANAFSSWFPRLRSIRTEITHGDVGHCSVDRQTNRVVYIHRGLGSEAKAFVIEDVVEELNRLARLVAEIIEAIYASLYSRLEPIGRTVPCGFYKGKCYERVVAASPDLSFNSGWCLSRTWFENEIGYECPMRQNCGAYQRELAKGGDSV